MLDIQDLRRDFQGLKRDFKELEVTAKCDLKEAKTALCKDFDVDLAELKADLLKWTVGMLLAQIVIIAALVKLL